MKKIVLAGLMATFAIVILGAACAQTSPNGDAAMNHDAMMNANSGMNMNHNAPMSHSGMTSSPNAAAQPYDLQFLDTMTHHHQGAVEMARVVLRKTQNEELKKFAQKIITDQDQEITQMKEWRVKWYAGQPAALNMEMPGMMDSMKMMSDDSMKMMGTATGKDFDLLFLDMMTPHHAGAVTMAREALQKASHPEIKTLATNIIKAQEAEIKMMADWKAKWSK